MLLVTPIKTKQKKTLMLFCKQKCVKLPKLKAKDIKVYRSSHLLCGV